MFCVGYGIYKSIFHNKHKTLYNLFSPGPAVSCVADTQASHHVVFCSISFRSLAFILPPPPHTHKLCLCWVYCLTLSVRACVRASVTFCFLNILKNHCWIFIKPCKHVHICKTNTLDKKSKG